MFEQIRHYLDLYENLINKFSKLGYDSKELSESELEFLEYSTLFFAKSLYKEMPCSKNVAKIILMLAEENNSL